MTALWIAFLAALVAAIGWRARHRAAARRALCRDRFAALLRQSRPGLSLIEPMPGRWQLQRGDSALAGGEAVTIEPPDGCGGSRLLLLPEALREGEVLFASVPAPGLLLVAADRGTLEAEMAERDEPAQPLPPVIFRVTAGGLRTES